MNSESSMQKEESSNERVFILTEGGKNIGLGHITRCLSICQAFEEQDITPELIINGEGTILDLLKNNKFQILDWLKEKGKVFRMIDGTEIVIIDSFLAGIDFYKTAARLTTKPVYIDDNKRLVYPKGTVVNVSIYAEELGYPEKEGTVYLLGTKYTILRKEFWNVPEKKIKREVESIMITFGGEDRENITPRLLESLNSAYPEFIKNVIIGRWFRNVKEIKNLKNRKTNLIYDPDEKKMKEIMFESDIAISAGGQTLYELARIGLPVVGICVVENQRNNINGWRRTGFLEYGGSYSDKDVFAKLMRAVNNILPYTERLKRSKVGRDAIDGKGAKRLCNFLLGQSV